MGVSTETAIAEDARPLVVIDPGHGGSNTGAIAPEVGISESQLTLSYARVLVEELEERGIRAVLTRNDNQYLTLRERARRATALQAAVFVSIHANASPTREQRGFETFILSPSSLAVDAPALRDDASARPGVKAEVSEILDDVERGLAHRGSARLAVLVQRALAKARPNAVNRGVKQDSMHVLLGATMPAVLVELGFIDHPSEGPELMHPRTRTRLASALADAIETFLKK
jgi:N-acetylmuramoyl-L-alanine amidase